MYDHFDMDDPRDTKFLADMFIVQKEYRKAFTDLPGSGTDSKITCKQGLISKIECCIDNLCANNPEPNFKNERNLYAEQLKCCILTKSPNLLKIIHEKFMPKVEEDDFEPLNQTLSRYLMPNKHNQSSFVRTLESGSVKMEGNSSFGSSHQDRKSQKASFTVRKKELNVEKNQNRDDTLVLHDSQIAHVKILSEESQNESEICPNTTDSGSKQEIYNVRLEDDDLVICKKEDLDLSKTTNLRTINLDLCEDSNENSIDDFKPTVENKQGSESERITDITPNDDFINSKFQNSTAEFKRPTIRESEITIHSIRCAENCLERNILQPLQENFQTQDNDQLEPMDTFSSSGIHKNMKSKQTCSYMSQYIKKPSATKVLGELNFTQENINTSIRSKLAKKSPMQKGNPKLQKKNRSPKPQIVSIKKHIERIRRSPCNKNLKKEINKHQPQAILRNHLSPRTPILLKEDTNLPLMNYSKFKDQLKKTEKPQKRNLQRKRSSVKINYNTKPYGRKNSINSTCINLYSSMKEQTVIKKMEEESKAIKSITKSLHTKMNRKRSHSKLHGFQTVDTDISISCKVPGSIRPKGLPKKEAYSRIRASRDISTTSRNKSLKSRKNSLVSKNCRLMQRKRSTFF
ncbi:unnamed protein product [Moneuplotes crassus]|uniref:Uncharacterized protein n=1 Tax=Euplotes crassus TaxID=5936 RepID=A0AAD1TZ69_EUPCR|nr:unnamed protein product [Moneuplotes crassus]